MHVEMEERVPGVPAAAAFDWWGDFAEGDHAFVPGLQRHVTADNDATMTVRDELRAGPLLLWREQLRARALDADGTQAARIVFDGANPLARFSGSYAFLPADDGVVIRLVAVVHPKGPLAWFERVGRPLVVAILRHDLRRHVGQMRGKPSAHRG